MFIIIIYNLPLLEPTFCILQLHGFHEGSLDHKSLDIKSWKIGNPLDLFSLNNYSDFL